MNWAAQRAHYRDLQTALTARGITVVNAWNGRHLRLRVRRNGAETTITIASTPRVPEYAVANTVSQAQRALNVSPRNIPLAPLATPQ